MNKREFLDECEKRFSETARRSAEDIVASAELIDYSIEYYTTDDRSDFVAAFDFYDYRVFQIRLYMPRKSDASHDAQFMLYDNPTRFRASKSEHFKLFSPVWRAAAYFPKGFPTGRIPLGVHNGVSRSCLSLGAYAGIANALSGVSAT